MPPLLRLAEREPADVIFSIAITQTMKRDLREIAHERRQSMSSIARRAIEREFSGEHSLPRPK